MYALVTAAGLLFAVGLTMDSWLGALVLAAGLTVGLYLDFTMVPLSIALTGLWFVRWWYTGKSARQFAQVFLASALGWGLFRPDWPHLAYAVQSLDGVTFFSHVRRAAGVARLGGAPIVAALAAGVIGLPIVTAAVWRGLQRLRFRAWWGWAFFAGFLLATAGLTVPRAYSAKQILVTGWPFVVLVAAWTLIECAPGKIGSSIAARAARLRLPATMAVSLAAAVATVATERADWRGVVAYLNAHASAQAVVWVDPSWNDLPYGYYHPVHPAVTAALSADNVPPAEKPDGPETWLVAERYGPPPPTSPSEAWLDRHWRLVEAVPFARLEIRKYAPPAAQTH